jgi:hypothetical protein
MICNAADTSVKYAKRVDGIVEFRQVLGATEDVTSKTWYVDQYDCTLTETSSPAIADFATLYGFGSVLFVLTILLFVLVFKR